MNDPMRHGAPVGRVINLRMHADDSGAMQALEVQSMKLAAVVYVSHIVVSGRGQFSSQTST